MRERALLVSALAVAAVATLGPLADAAERSFTWHETQHVTLLLVVAPLLILGLPRLARTLALLPPLASFGVYLAVIAAAHAPAVDLWSRQSALAHGAEHLALAAAGCVFWSQLVGPQVRLSYALRIAVLLLATGAHAIIGGLIAFADRLLYPGYDVGARDAVGDQAFGGGIFWIPPKIVFIAAITVLFFRWLDREERARVAEEADGGGEARSSP